MLNQLLFPLVALLLAGSAMAAANVTSLRGDATVITTNGNRSALANGSRVLSGSRVVTGPDGLVVMTFDDGQIVALEKNTDFRIDQFHYNSAAPAEGNAFFSMLRGSLRAVTGLIGRSNKAAFRLETPTATIGIRGSDWMAALQNGNLYTGVKSGGIIINNTVNALLVDASQFSLTVGIRSSALIGQAQLPVDIFGSLPSLSFGGVAGSASVGSGATSAGTAAAGASTAAIAAGVAVAAGVAATSNSDDSTATHHAATSH